MTSITGDNGYSSNDYQPAINKSAPKRHHYGLHRPGLQGNKAKKLHGNKRKTKYYFYGWFSQHSLIFLSAAFLQGTIYPWLVSSSPRPTKLETRLTPDTCVRWPRPVFTAVLITGLIIPSLVVGHAQGEFSDTLIVDENGTLYDDLSCSQRDDLRERLDDGFRPLENATMVHTTKCNIIVLVLLCLGRTNRVRRRQSDICYFILMRCVI